ncbi:MAG: hypothetical protein LBE09_00850 [Christensenellaceae bacterium]|jgi:hypothetical protein|nr:hypothetical protein [Christensenellaceae bacterium]
MIFKIRKKMYEIVNDYALTSCIGDTLFKVAHIRNGFYFYNTRGEQIAQLTFNRNEARISVPHVITNVPTIITVARDEIGNFYFSYDTNTPDDNAYISSVVPSNDGAELTIWGNLVKYSFDIYEGPSLSASVVPVLDDPAHYMIKLEEQANILQMVMMVIALETLNDGIVFK